LVENVACVFEPIIPDYFRQSIETALSEDASSLEVREGVKKKKKKKLKNCLNGGSPKIVKITK